MREEKGHAPLQLRQAHLAAEIVLTLTLALTLTLTLTAG